MHALLAYFVVPGFTPDMAKRAIKVFTEIQKTVDLLKKEERNEIQSWKALSCRLALNTNDLCALLLNNIIPLQWKNESSPILL